MNERGFEQKPEYSVWVGGVKVNDHYLRLQEAQDLANDYEVEYIDVIIRKEI